jgi:hypothetical protein
MNNLKVHNLNTAKINGEMYRRNLVLFGVLSEAPGILEGYLTLYKHHFMPKSLWGIADY